MTMSMNLPFSDKVPDNAERSIAKIFNNEREL